jgi:hypothetical protein
VSEKYIEKKQTLSPVRWIRNLDIKMRSQNRDILLLINNFSGHFINYIPQNIDIVYFTPNITSHIQPLDAGAIRCLKAWYKRLFCERAIDLDNANEAEIYKINLYESMRLTEKAWSMVSAETLLNCWKHTGIVPEEAKGTAEMPLMQQVGWNIIESFAASEMMLPNAEKALQAALGDSYRDEDWRDALVMVNDTEPDEASNLPQRITELRKTIASRASSSTSSTSPSTTAATKAIASEQLALEAGLNAQLQELAVRRRIFEVPTAQELLDNPDELQVGEMSFGFENDQEIIEAVRVV